LVLHAAPSSEREIPFEFREGLIWVKVTVPQSPAPLNFLVDSGANVSVVDLRVAQRLNVKLGHKVEVRGVDTQVEGFWPQRLAAKAGRMTLPKKYLAVDLSRLGQSCRCAVDGLIGADFFLDRIVQIDFSRERIRLLNQPPPAVSGESLPLEIRREVFQVLVDVESAGPQWMRLDTGCASPLEWVVGSTRALGDSHKISIGLAETRIPQAPITVSLGKMEFQNVVAGVHERELFPSERGLLGNGLLSRFASITVDSKSRRLILDPLPDPTSKE
jgi:hypothetical protein